MQLRIAAGSCFISLWSIKNNQKNFSMNLTQEGSNDIFLMTDSGTQVHLIFFQQKLLNEAGIFLGLNDTDRQKRELNTIVA